MNMLMCCLLLVETSYLMPGLSNSQKCLWREETDVKETRSQRVLWEKERTRDTSEQRVNDEPRHQKK